MRYPQIIFPFVIRYYFFLYRPLKPAPSKPSSPLKGRDLVRYREGFGVSLGGIWWRVIDLIVSVALGQRGRPPTSKPILRSLRQPVTSRYKWLSYLPYAYDKSEVHKLAD